MQPDEPDRERQRRQRHVARDVQHVPDTGARRGAGREEAGVHADAGRARARPPRERKGPDPARAARLEDEQLDEQREQERRHRPGEVGDGAQQQVEGGAAPLAAASAKPVPSRTPRTSVSPRSTAVCPSASSIVVWSEKFSRDGAGRVSTSRLRPPGGRAPTSSTARGAMGAARPASAAARRRSRSSRVRAPRARASRAAGVVRGRPPRAETSSCRCGRCKRSRVSATTARTRPAGASGPCAPRAARTAACRRSRGAASREPGRARAGDSGR